MAASPAVDVCSLHPPSTPPPFCAGSISPGIVLGAVSRRSDEWLEGGRTKREKEGKRESERERNNRSSFEIPATPCPGLLAQVGCRQLWSLQETPQYRTSPDAASRRFDNRLNKPPPPWISLHLSTVLHAASRRDQSEFRSEARVRDSLQVGSPLSNATHRSCKINIYFFNLFSTRRLNMVQYVMRSFLVWFSS